MNRLQFYQQHYADTYLPTLHMSREGIRCDRAKLQARYDELNQTLDALREKLRQQAGEDLFGKKGSISGVKARKFFFETLGCTPIWKNVKTKSGKQLKLSVDENAVRTIRRRNKKRPEVVQACDDILAFRFADARKKFCKPEVVDKDGRIRGSYYFNTLTLRFGSKKNPMDTGHNMQNCPRGERGHFLPDKGHVFLKRDLSQAESRMVYMLTGDEDLIAKARALPTEYDDHIEIALCIIGILYREGIVDSPRYEDLPVPQQKLLRFFGKMTNHGSNYGETGMMVSIALLELGYVVAPEICQQMIDAKMEARPAILDVFQRGIRRLITTDKILTTPLGHRLDFTHVKRDQRAFRQGYMFIPQSTVPMIMNQYGMVPLYWEIKDQGWRAKIRNQIHDELLISVHPEDAYEVATFLGRSLMQPVEYTDLTIHRRKQSMTIPSTLAVGVNWGTSHEWKAEPSRKEFERVLEGLLSNPQ
jgi:DNA polymerase I-like protein with 3'-5' exonuclease and polymerase domains